MKNYLLSHDEHLSLQSFRNVEKITLLKDNYCLSLENTSGIVLKIILASNHKEDLSA
jgi:hypothetical protein